MCIRDRRIVNPNFLKNMARHVEMDSKRMPCFNNCFDVAKNDTDTKWEELTCTEIYNNTRMLSIVS